MEVRVLRLSSTLWESFYFGFKAFDYVGAQTGARPDLPEGYGDELEIAAVEGIATGYGTLTETSWERAMTLTLSLEMALRETMKMSNSDIQGLLDRLERDAGQLFSDKLPHLVPPKAPRDGTSIRPEQFFMKTQAMAHQLGQPSQHIGMVGPYWRGGAYRVEEATLKV